MVRGGERRNGEIHLTEREMITALLLNDSPNRLKGVVGWCEGAG